MRIARDAAESTPGRAGRLHRRPAQSASTRRSSARSSQPHPSWFASFASGADTGFEETGAAGRHTESPPPESAGPDSRLIARQSRRLLGSSLPSFLRIYRAFLGARTAVSLLLLVAQFVAYVLGVGLSPLGLGVALVYQGLTALAWWQSHRTPLDEAASPGPRRLSHWQWLSTIGLDIAVFGALHLVAPRGTVNFLPLLVLPVLMAGVLTRRPAAVASASAVALMLLGEAWLRVPAASDATAALAQAALVGSGFFVIALLAGELAGRLAREERAARGSMELARQQARLNRLVIEEMHDGVLVVDRRGRVRGANPAARRLLAREGVVRDAPFPLAAQPEWSPLAELVDRGFSEGRWPQGGCDVQLSFGPGEVRSLRVRLRFTRRREPDLSEELCVVFLEDQRDVQARMRQEKLAAMGRMSAGIAHEIRNPLSAIAQANALLAEDAQEGAQRQLTQMVADNVERLKRIVDDVMEVAPGGPAARAPVVDVKALTAMVCGDWARTSKLPTGDDSPLRVELPAEPLGAAFDPEHLRRVLVNLLDNAHRHARGGPGCITVSLLPDEPALVLSVLNDGPEIPPDVERYLFEPFFSTRSRGSGLGLYICKELCERYGATIDYRVRGSRPHTRNEFYVVMRSEPLPFMTVTGSRPD